VVAGADAEAQVIVTLTPPMTRKRVMRLRRQPEIEAGGLSQQGCRRPGENQS
jgi:hypothetical protein